MPPHVLAIEPDLRQAAIVKRIVREKVLADVTVVDSRDAALEAMRTTVPDVLLLSALLSPRDEDELIAHLRTLEHAEHLQTHTIPQLASSMGHDEDKPSRGLLAAFRRRKGGGAAPAGCDPELFADEVRTYLKRASDKKREVSDAAVAGVITPGPGTRPMGPPPVSDTSADSEPAVTSSWASPFEWRPARETKAKSTAAAAGPVVAPSAEPIVARAAEPIVAPAAEPVVAPATEAVVAPAAEAVVAPAAEAFVAPAAEAFIASTPEPIVVREPEPVVIPVPNPEPVVVRAKLPLVKRYAHDWWFEENDVKDAQRTRLATETDSELRSVLASLSVPLHVAAFAYPNGCRIRRVRIATS